MQQPGASPSRTAFANGANPENPNNSPLRFGPDGKVQAGSGKPENGASSPRDAAGGTKYAGGGASSYYEQQREERRRKAAERKSKDDALTDSWFQNDAVDSHHVGR